MTPNPTRRERIRQQTIAEILDAGRAQAVAGERLSLRGIAATLGLTSPALYRYFVTADILHDAVAAAIMRDLRTAIVNAEEAELVRLRADGDPDLVPPLLRVVRHWMAERPGEWRVLVESPGQPAVQLLLDRLEHALIHPGDRSAAPSVTILAAAGDVL